ncbi:MAG: DUF4115 domain-containing protein, partial [Candidatus Omnitrophica bacterium]|nr:DUF4115 domain-containing protein [Candidatus Omnitrophota bacterium]
LDYNDVNGNILEEDIDEDLFDGSIPKNSKTELIAEKEEDERIRSKQEENIEPEPDLEPEINIDPEQEPESQQEEKIVDDFNPENKGEILKRERLKRGLSLEFIHEITKVPMDVLRAIEEGYKVRNLSTFYLKGFLKIYAKYLDIAVDRVVEDYRPEKLPIPVKYESTEFDINKWLSNIFTKKRKQQIVIALGLLLSLFVIFKIAAFIANLKPKQKIVKVDKAKKDTKKSSLPEKKITVRKPQVAAEKTNIVPKKEEIKEAKAVPQKKVVEKQPLKKSIEEKQVIEPAKVISAVIPPQNVAPKVISSANTEVSVQKNVSLTVRAKKNSWLSVKVDGNVVFQSTLRLGSVETWMADESIEISGKNINQLDFELNGKMIRSLGRKDSKAKRLIVTKEGLTVTN